MLVTNVFVNATKQLINTWQTCQQFVYVKHTHLKILCATMPDRFYLKCTRERMHERNKDTPSCKKRLASRGYNCECLMRFYNCPFVVVAHTIKAEDLYRQPYFGGPGCHTTQRMASHWLKG